jgi:signal-transduction protein with cAMP-binding, CBS, and nucleotidyltransferase domain
MNFIIILLLVRQIFQPDDYIIRRGTTGSHMFFIQEGSVSVLNDSGRLIKRISTGSYFGGDSNR